MSYKPDYGLRLMNSGVSRHVDHFFYDFRLYSLTVLNFGQYSTKSNPLRDSLSVDFVRVIVRERHLVIGITDGVVPNSDCRSELFLMAI
jgi:hypothetical protein